MLERLKAMFAGAERRAPEAMKLELAVGALLVEAARADETYTEEEKSLIDRALAAHFSLAGEEAQALREEAEAVQAEALDIHRFTKRSKAMAAADKIKLVERLWEIVLSDGARDPHEDALIRRVCGLIYVSDVDSGAARRRVAARMKQQSQG